MKASFSIRPAVQDDFPEIRALIRAARINPLGLDWRRFVVAIHCDGLAGCGQLKPVPGGVTELASLAVQTQFRRQGVARALIACLLDSSPRPLYLTCRSGLGPFYEKFGFLTAPSERLPAYYQRLQCLAGLMMGLSGRAETLLVMKLD